MKGANSKLGDCLPLTVLAFLLPLAAAYGAKTPPFSSPFTKMVSAQIPSGEIISSSTSHPILKKEIREQLKFLVGSLNAHGAGVAIDYRMRVRIHGIRKSDGLFRVTYSAEFLVAWDASKPKPDSLPLTLPLRGDAKSLETYYESHGADCADFDDEGDWDKFFYFYRPEQCYLSSHNKLNDNVKTVMRFGPYIENTKGKRPNYNEVWKDGELRVLAVFGNTGEDNFIDNTMYFIQEVQETLGPPVSEKRVKYEGFETIHLTYGHWPRRVTLNIIHIREGTILTKVGGDLQGAYNRLSQYSDVISYNGHSGYGKNIRTLSRWGNFTRNQYTIFFLNGCDSFSYINLLLLNRFRRLNACYHPTRFIDIITTSLPSWFVEMPVGTAKLVLSLWRREENYSQILKSIANGVPMVIGEEDNPDHFLSRK